MALRFSRRRLWWLAVLLPACQLGAQAAHPRLWLDAPTLLRLKTKAQAGSPQWTSVKSNCDTLATRLVLYPDGVPACPSGQNCIGEGYQGSDYYDPIFALGICYQTALQLGQTSLANTYGAKGAEILEKMSNPAHSPNFLRDSGYGIRFYGVAMAIGYDWLYGALSPAVRTQVYTQWNGWVTAFDQNGFLHDQPYDSNYFAGYYAAKGLGALATEGDNPSAPAMWSDWLDRLHHQMVQPYYALWKTGGGWAEGWNYGHFATRNMTFPLLGAKTAKGLDLIHDPAAPMSWPLDQAHYLIHFTWPSRRTIDDRGKVYESDNPTATSSSLYTTITGFLAAYGDARLPELHNFTRTVRTLQGGTGGWTDFLFWDDATPETDFRTLPLSYRATGMQQAAMRSDWNESAVWASFTSGPYIGAPYSGEEFFDQGGLAIVRGNTPFLVNASGHLMRYPGPSLEDAMYTENFTYPGPRRIYNVLLNNVATAGGQDDRNPNTDQPAAQTRLTRFEDQGAYVLMRGARLEDTYDSSNGITSWTRDVVYLRPKLFLLHDRASVTNTTGDAFMAFHFPKTPALAGAPSTGATRYDVSEGATFKGAMTTLFPPAAATTLVDVFDAQWTYRIEVRPPAPATSMRFLTVLDASDSAAAVALGARLSASDGSSSANVLGALLRGAGANDVVLFGSGSATQTVTGTITFRVPNTATHVLITDLPPSTTYAVSSAPSGPDLNVTVQPGGGPASSANGALYFSLDSQVVPNAPAGLVAAPASGTRVDLAWSDTSANETGFRLERRTGAASFTPIATLATNVTSYQDSGLAPDTAYVYRVNAFNPVGDSSYSNEAGASTNAALPEVPAGLTARGTSYRQVHLTWADTSSNETGFKLERRPRLSGAYAQIAAPPAGSTSFDDSVPASAREFQYRVRATNAAGDSGFAAEAVASVFTKGDLSQDLKTDLLLRRLSTGENRLWRMDGTTRATEAAISPDPPAGEQVFAVDDFDGDQRNDLVFRNLTTGEVHVWLMDGATRVGSAQNLTAPTLPLNWKLAAAADFDRDEHPDILWRNETSQILAVWLMNGTTKVGNLTPTPDHAVDPNWEVVAALDWNGDSFVDLLWYNSTTGRIVLWFLDQNLVRSTGQFTNPMAAGDNNWRVLAAGDYGAGPDALAGTADIVWRNATSGRYVAWLMDRQGNRTTGTFTNPDAPTTPLDWTIVGPK